MSEAPVVGPSFLNSPELNATKRVWYSWTPAVDQSATFVLNSTAPFLRVNVWTGEVYGLPTSAGTYLVEIIAANDNGTATLAYNLTVADVLNPPVTEDNGTTNNGNNNGQSTTTAEIPERYLITILAVLAVFCVIVVIVARRR